MMNSQIGPALAARRLSALFSRNCIKTAPTSAAFMAAMQRLTGRFPAPIGTKARVQVAASSAHRPSQVKTGKRQICQSWRLSMGSPAEIEERIEHDPDDVDEVPVKRRRLFGT